MIITKEICDRLLLANNKNRPVSKHRVEAIARTMANGSFVPNNGQTIVVTASWDRLLDGQHRLYAMRNSGGYGFDIPIVTVPDEMADEVFKTIDIVRGSRSNSQILSLTTDIPNAKRVSAMFYSFLTVAGGMTSPSPSEIINYYRKYESTVLKMKIYAQCTLGKITPHAAFWGAVFNAILISGDEDGIINRVRNILDNKCNSVCDNLILNIIVMGKSGLRMTSTDEFFKVTKGLLYPELKAIRLADNEDLSKLKAKNF